MPSRTRLQLTRIASLFLSFAFGVVGLGVGINALVKFLQEKRTLSAAVPAGTVVHISTGDVLSTGYVVTVACGLIAVASLLFLLPIFLAPALAGRTLKIQGAILTFLSVWLFATLVPFTDFFANKSAQISASIGSVQIPQSTIQGIVASLGATTRYRDIEYLRLPAILMWFTLLFGVTSAVLSFLDARSARTVRSGGEAYGVSPATDGGSHEGVAEKEKQRMSQDV
ncbi:uncharacterized protein PHACADRAFT_266141 [Phanerochaete carnosa HHB-10118-sp]|uniref:Uncharacterized protein n=1 Tax=Phanerochaete carnosa (strain HHB-10118-sp) TaxID=650164 RepID=K5UH42_PHACS|nr:uncharacterized protein PHACADRAFT_266141 [Phanerochaete carnosa HHB-10118-sp]EKM48786.1 hypothetical protein PHACADRAFT_266141 [Phanerochaete carnosa HHB-10118-sp]